MNRYTLYKILFVISSFSLSACYEPEDYKFQTVCRRTVMIYMAAENSLSTFAHSDIRELKAGAKYIPDDCRLLVYLDDRQSCPRIYDVNRITGDTVRLFTYPAEMCSAEPEIFKEALERMRTLAPAEQYGLVLWSHGAGWLPGEQASHTRSIFQDDNYKKGKGVCRMSVDDLHEVLAGGEKSLFLFFDACLMQGIEVDYALRDVTDYIIASPAEIPAHGAMYDRMIPSFFAKNFSPTDMAGIYYNTELSYLAEFDRKKGGGVVISVVKTKELDAFAKITRKLIGGETLDVNGAQKYWSFSQSDRYSVSQKFPDFLDMLGVMRKFSGSPYYDEWLAQLHRTVVFVGATPCWDSVCDTFEYWRSEYAYGYRGQIVNVDDICGMSVFVPQDKYNLAGKSWNQDIKETDWWKAVM